MTEDLLDRLAREALPQAKEAAATQGYFSAQVELTVDRSKQPADITLTVIAGEPTLVTETTIVVIGPAQLDVPTGTDAIASVKKGWGLPVGDVFLRVQVVLVLFDAGRVQRQQNGQHAQPGSEQT